MSKADKKKGVKKKVASTSPVEEPKRGFLYRVTVGNWRHIDREWMSKEDGSFDWRPIIVFVTVCVVLTLQNYYGERGNFQEFFPERWNGSDIRSNTEYGALESFVWWTGCRVFGYVIIPMIAILCMPGERIRDYFISFRGFISHLWIYMVLFALVFPAVIVAAQWDSFLHTYPFYKQANRSAFDFWAWQGLYAVQFLSLEFFFRGFMLKATAPKLGSSAIFVMLIPYCMIHFGKPVSETLGAVLAGAVLGSLALRTKSIWGGVLIHVSVAFTMDFLAVGECPSAESGQPCRTR